MIPPTKPPFTRSQLFLCLTLGVIVCLAYIQHLAAHDATYSAWSDRDVYRGAQMWSDFEAAGAELSGGPGARIPGP
jgi:hypothetical protein